MESPLEFPLHAWGQPPKNPYFWTKGSFVPHPGDGGCAEGFHLVTDEESCQVGAKFFKKPFVPCRETNAGCETMLDGMIGRASTKPIKISMQKSIEKPLPMTDPWCWYIC